MLWAFDGWADLSFVAGEVKDPRRKLPRAIIIGTLAVIAIYLLANLAYLAVHAGREDPPLEARRGGRRAALIGAPGVVFVAVTVMLSTFGTLNGTMLTAPRVFFAMADDGLFFKQVAAVHPRYQTPYVAIVLTAALGVVFVLLRTFEQLADSSSRRSCRSTRSRVAAIFVLRRRAGYDPPFRVPGYPVVPLLFIASRRSFCSLNAIIDKSSRWRDARRCLVRDRCSAIPVYAFITRRMGSSARRS